MPTKIGLRDIAAMQPNSILWDSAVRGFNARRQFSDVVTFNVFYRTQDGTQRPAGTRSEGMGIFKPDVARQEARRIPYGRSSWTGPKRGERSKLRNSMTVLRPMRLICC